MLTEIECVCWHDWQLTMPFIQGLDASGEVTVTELRITDNEHFPHQPCSLENISLSAMNRKRGPKDWKDLMARYNKVCLLY